VDKLTLQELAMAFSMSRERIRQLEEKAIGNLHNVLIANRYPGKNYHVHPELQEAICEIAEFVVSETKHPIAEDTLLSIIQKRFGFDTETVKYSLFFVFTLCGIGRIEFSNDILEPIWGVFDKSQEKIFESNIFSLHQLLTQEVATPISEVDILISLNKKRRKIVKFL
jgi:hypothetical protein